jgi:hypothetical protein
LVALEEVAPDLALVDLRGFIVSSPSQLRLERPLHRGGFGGAGAVGGGGGGGSVIAAGGAGVSDGRGGSGSGSGVGDGDSSVFFYGHLGSREVLIKRAVGTASSLWAEVRWTGCFSSSFFVRV